MGAEGAVLVLLRLFRQSIDIHGRVPRGNVSHIMGQAKRIDGFPLRKRYPGLRW